jgi:hypothetical protein
MKVYDLDNCTNLGYNTIAVVMDDSQEAEDVYNYVYSNMNETL